MSTMKQCTHCKPGIKINQGYDEIPDGKDFYDYYIDMIDPNEESELNRAVPDGSWKEDLDAGICPFCKNQLTDTLMTPEDCHAIAESSNYNRELLLAMLELRKKDIIEFEIKMQPFRQMIEAEENKNIPHCPYCNSTNLLRITAKDKIVNIALFGLLGNKRRYQWHCIDCNSDF